MRLIFGGLSEKKLKGNQAGTLWIHNEEGLKIWKTQKTSVQGSPQNLPDYMMKWAT